MADVVGDEELFGHEMHGGTSHFQRNLIVNAQHARICRGLCRASERALVQKRPSDPVCLLKIQFPPLSGTPEAMVKTAALPHAADPSSSLSKRTCSALCSNPGCIGARSRTLSERTPWPAEQSICQRRKQEPLAIGIASRDTSHKTPSAQGGVHRV